MAAVFVLLAALILHPGRAQQRTATQQSGPPTTVKATPSALGGTGTAPPTAVQLTTHAKQLPAAVAAPAALPLTPANPALIDFHPSPNLLVSGPKDPPRVALTFDAGSDAKAVPLLLKTLEHRHVRATFFLTGRFCENFPRECRAIADAGMELGNHSYRHPHFTHLSEAQIRQELERAEAAIVQACGRGAKPLFRFPYGDCDDRTQRIVAAAGYQPIRWTLDSLDAFRNPKTADFVVDRITSRLQPGYITLMHVSCITSAEALPRIFDRLGKMGAQQVPVSELLPASHPSENSPTSAPTEKIDH